MATVEKNDNVRAVGRALEILLAFTAQDYELSAGELLKRVNLSRPTLYRLLYTLQEHGFLDAVGEPQRFRLGPSVAKLAHVWTSSLDLAAIAQPILQKIWRDTEETVAMFVPQGELRLCVAELPSPQPLNFKLGVGYTERIVRGASGRVILAHMPDAVDNLAHSTRDTEINPKTLAAELAQIRQRGFASSHDQMIPGAAGIAVPFFDRNGVVAGSIGLFGPEVRLGEDRLEDFARLLTEQAGVLSSHLGYRNAPAVANT